MEERPQAWIVTVSKLSIWLALLEVEPLNLIMFLQILHCKSIVFPRCALCMGVTVHGSLWGDWRIVLPSTNFEHALFFSSFIFLLPFLESHIKLYSMQCVQTGFFHLAIYTYLYAWSQIVFTLVMTATDSLIILPFLFSPSFLYLGFSRKIILTWNLISYSDSIYSIVVQKYYQHSGNKKRKTTSLK